jgi:uncharacterized protein with PIN domain
LVRFWDASALVPLFQLEPQTPRASDLLSKDPDVIVWVLTRVELMSAIARRRREEPHSGAQWLAARRKILEASRECIEIAMIETVREQAERVVAAHPLRSADALQLGPCWLPPGEVPPRFSSSRLTSASPLRPSAKDSRSLAQTELWRVFYWAT